MLVVVCNNKLMQGSKASKADKFLYLVLTTTSNYFIKSFCKGNNYIEITKYLFKV
jgi:hypothetical protein